MEAKMDLLTAANARLCSGLDESKQLVTTVQQENSDLKAVHEMRQRVCMYNLQEKGVACREFFFLSMDQLFSGIFLRLFFFFDHS